MNTKELILVAPKLGIGGIQRAVTNLANWLTESGYSVSLVSCKNEDIFYDLNKEVKVYVPDFSYEPRRIFLGLYYFKVILYLRSVFRKSSSPVVFSFGESFNPLTILASIGLRRTVYVSDRTIPDFRFPKYVKLLKKKTYPIAQGLVCQTSRSKKWNDDFFQGDVNCHVIPNMVKIRSSSSVPKEKWILYVGRLSWEKGPERLVEAFSKMENRNNYRLIICGSGPLQMDLRSKCIQLGIDTMVDFKGQVKDVDYFYRRAKIFALPSHLEGFPNAMCEAMASGLPAICYDTIPFEDLGEPGQDFLVAVDTIDFGKKLDQLTIDDELCEILSFNARKAMTKLSMDEIGDAFLNLYLKHVE